MLWSNECIDTDNPQAKLEQLAADVACNGNFQGETINPFPADPSLSVKHSPWLFGHISHTMADEILFRAADTFMSNSPHLHKRVFLLPKLFPFFFLNSGREI